MEKTNQEGVTQVINGELKVSYIAHGEKYSVFEDGDTVRFYRLERKIDGEKWELTDIYLKA